MTSAAAVSCSSASAALRCWVGFAPNAVKARRQAAIEGRSAIGVDATLVEAPAAGIVADAQDLIRMAGVRHPDVVVTDIKMPTDHTDDGLRAAPEAAAASTVGEAGLACRHLDELMGCLAPCFARVEPCRQARKYVTGLSSDLPRKNCSALAEQAGTGRRT